MCVPAEEESQLVQEKADSLRIRYSVLSLSGADVLQRLEQALEASQRCTSSQEELHLWLGRIERELLGVGSQPLPGEGVLCTTERLRVRYLIMDGLLGHEDSRCTMYRGIPSLLDLRDGYVQLFCM